MYLINDFFLHKFPNADHNHQQMVPAKRLASEQEYMSDSVPSEPPTGRMYHTMSELSLQAGGPGELGGPQGGGGYGLEQVGTLVGGERSFQSKRFSRNLEPVGGLGLKRAQSFHIDQRGDGDQWLDSQIRSFSRGATSRNSVNSDLYGGAGKGGRVPGTDSSDEEDSLGPHFTSTVTSSTRVPSEVTGSYLARQEFGSSSEVVQTAGPDSGYVSHSSGTGGYPKLQLSPNSNTIKSFTMSVDRRFLGGPSATATAGQPGTSTMDFNRYRSICSSLLVMLVISQV